MSISDHPSPIALGRATAHRLLPPGATAARGPGHAPLRGHVRGRIVAGATSMGVDVHRLGVCPTPALSFVTGDLDYGAGIMVSASHNPADDNGLKVLDDRGSSSMTGSRTSLEALLWRADELPSPTNGGLASGRRWPCRPRPLP